MGRTDDLWKGFPILLEAEPYADQLCGESTQQSENNDKNRFKSPVLQLEIQFTYVLVDKDDINIVPANKFFQAVLNVTEWSV